MTLVDLRCRCLSKLSDCGTSEQRTDAPIAGASPESAAASFAGTRVHVRGGGARVCARPVALRGSRSMTSGS